MARRARVPINLLKFACGSGLNVSGHDVADVEPASARRERIRVELWGRRQSSDGGDRSRDKAGITIRLLGCAFESIVPPRANTGARLGLRYRNTGWYRR